MSGSAPPDNSLLPQQFFFDTSGSGKIWAGLVGAPGRKRLVLDTADVANKVPVAGGTMTGLLILSGDPVAPLGAATKQYADARLPLAGGALTGPLSLPNGSASAPSLAFAAANNGMYYSGGIRFVLAGLQKLQIANQIIGAVPFLAPAGTQAAPGLGVNDVGSGFFGKSAGSISFATANTEVVNWQAGGITAYVPVTLAADPTVALGAATKQYVDNRAPLGGPYLPIAGGILTGSLTVGSVGATPALSIGNNTATGTTMWLAGAVSTGRSFIYTTAGLRRWLLGMGAGAEPGSNAGGDFWIRAYADDGVTVASTPLYFARQTGLVTVVGDPTNALGIATKQYADKFATGVVPMTGGLSFGSNVVVSTTDLSKHIALYSTTFGFSVTSARLNYLVSSGSHVFVVAGVDIATVSNTGLAVNSGALVTGNFSVGAVGGSATVNLGNNTATQTTITMNGAAATNRQIIWATAGANRWNLTLAGLESGSDAGGNLNLVRFSDTGTNLGSTLTINRNTGLILVQNALQVNGNVGFNGVAPPARPAITGSRGGNAALASLLTQLASTGLITDTTTA
jgi:hypothetical protein